MFSSPYYAIYAYRIHLNVNKQATLPLYNDLQQGLSGIMAE